MMLFMDELAIKSNDNQIDPLPESGLGRMMVGGKKEKGRREHDFYPTQDAPIDAFIAAEKSVLDFFRWNKIRIWEPACGDGAISKRLETFGCEVLSTDLIYRGFGLGGKDFLLSSGPIKTPIITNPPYGDLPEEFIRHAIKLESPYIALLLKANFFHTAAHARLFTEFPYTREYRIPWRLDFTGQNNPTMTFSWFVWDRLSPRPTSSSPYIFSLRKPEIQTNQKELF